MTLGIVKQYFHLGLGSGEILDHHQDQLFSCMELSYPGGPRGVFENGVRWLQKNYKSVQ